MRGVQKYRHIHERNPFDHVPVNEKRDRIEPIRDGIPVGTIRETVPDVETFYIPCEYCGHIAARSKWQSENSFYCWECSTDNMNVGKRKEPHRG